MSIAQSVIKKCGGAARVAKITGRTEATVYRWTYDKEKGGTGGLIPSDMQVKLMDAAREGLIDLCADDFFEGAA